jgi:hypothetical protein
LCEGSPGFRKILVAQNPHQDPAISDRVLATLAEPTRLAAGFGPRVTLDIPVIHPVDGSPAPDALCLDSAWPNFRPTNSKYNDSRIKLVRPLVLFLPLSVNLNLPPPIFFKDQPNKVPHASIPPSGGGLLPSLKTIAKGKVTVSTNPGTERRRIQATKFLVPFCAEAQKEPFPLQDGGGRGG